MCGASLGGGAEYQLQSQEILGELVKATVRASWSFPAVARMPRFEVSWGVPEAEGTAEAEAVEAVPAVPPAAVEEEMVVAVVAGVSVVEATVDGVGVSTGVEEDDASVVAAAVVDEGTSTAVLVEELDAGTTTETLIEELVGTGVGVSVETGLDATWEETAVVGSLGKETDDAKVNEELPWPAVTVMVGVTVTDTVASEHSPELGSSLAPTVDVWRTVTVLVTVNGTMGLRDPTPPVQETPPVPVVK